MKQLMPLLVALLMICPTDLSGQPRDETGGGQRGAGRASPGGSSGPTAGPTKDRKRDRRGSPVQRALNERVERVEWDDESLESVAEWLENQGNINVIVMWTVLEIEGIDRETPITLRMRNTTVRSVLNAVLDQIGGGDVVRFLGYGNTLKISTRTDLNRKLYTRVYDVADLIFRAPDYFYTGPPFGVSGGMGGMGGGGLGGGGFGGGGFGGGGFGGGSFGGGGFGGGGFGGGGYGGSGGRGGFGGGGFGGRGGGYGGGGEGEGDVGTAEERMDDLVDLIINTIEPDSWAENGGLGTIKALNKLLVVRNNIEVHEKLGGPFFKEGL